MIALDPSALDVVERNKAALRQTMRARRATLCLGAPRAADRVAQALPEAIMVLATRLGRPTRSPPVVALYADARSELSTRPIEAALLEAGCEVAYPRTAAGTKRLSFHVSARAGHVPGRFGIDEPRAGIPSIRLSQLCAVIVPGLAFDAEGRRLGWGGGYYDATLAEDLSVPRVGVCFAAQVVQSVPVTARDVVMDCVMTEAGVAGRCAEDGYEFRST